MIGIVKMSSKGQIVIPRDVRDKLGLNAGDYILIELDGYEVRLRKIKPIEKFKGILRRSISDSELEEGFEEAMAKGEV